MGARYAQTPPHKVSKVRCGTLHTARALGRRNQRLCERSPTCNCEHARPTTSPHEKRAAPKGRGLPSSSRGEMVEESHSFITPTASSFDANNHQTAAVPVDKFSVLTFHVGASLAQHSPRMGGRCESGPQCDVHSDLGTVMERQPSRQHLDRTHVGCGNSDMSRRRTLHRTVAPASLHTLERVRSGPTALDRNLLDLGEAARWRPCTSRRAPHSH